jgi:hypothetical protein
VPRGKRHPQTADLVAPVLAIVREKDVPLTAVDALAALVRNGRVEKRARTVDARAAAEILVMEGRLVRLERPVRYDVPRYEDGDGNVIA